MTKKNNFEFLILNFEFQRLSLPRHFKGVPYYQAEIIPIVPDTGNAETGKDATILHYPLFSVFNLKIKS